MSDKSIHLLDADDSSITITWPAIKSSSSSSPTKYSLQYRASTSSSDNGIDSGGALLYTSLGTEVTNTQARKRNLTGAGYGFWFRVSAATKTSTRVDKNAMNYITHEKPFKVLTMMEQSLRMQTPMAKLDSSAENTPKSYVAHVSWLPYAGCDVSLLLGYKLQMRENDGGAKWTTVAPCLTGTEVRKKNLTSSKGYMFRVRPVLRGESGGSESNLETGVSEGGSTTPYSCASEIVAVKSAKKGKSSSSSGVLKLFSGLPKNSLLAKGGLKTVSLSEALGDVDLVFFYASASSSTTCKKFTPQLVSFYNDAKAQYASAPTQTKSVEVVFLSADQDASSFKLYYATMPWLAVPFDCEVREKLLEHIKVTGVPRLTVLEGKTGKVLESNSVGKALDLGRFSRKIK